MPIEEIEKGGLWNNTFHHLYKDGRPRALPGIIIAGDGHGSSARGMCHSWAGGAADYLSEHVRANRVCLHMEIHQDQVAGVPLPNALERARGKTFGFEIGALQRAHVVERELMEIMGTEGRFDGNTYNVELTKGIINRIENLMIEFTDMSKKFLALDGAFEVNGILTNLTNDTHSTVTNLAAFYDYFGNILNNASDDEQRPSPELAAQHRLLVQTCLTAYNCILGAWRDMLNPIFSAKISQKIAMYPTDLHIVSIGDAHLSAQPGSGDVYLLPMQKFIRRSENMWGIVDKSKGLGMR